MTSVHGQKGERMTNFQFGVIVFFLAAILTAIVS